MNVKHAILSPFEGERHTLDVVGHIFPIPHQLSVDKGFATVLLNVSSSKGDQPHL